MKHAESIPPNECAASRDRLEIYIDLIRRWNERINLVSRGDIGNLWGRHVDDALQLLPLMVHCGEGDAIDLGSGAGFPGMVLAIASGKRFHLVDSDRRKAIFLREVARETAAPVVIHHARIEALSVPPVPLITARALAPLDTLLAWAAPRLAPGGFCLFPKGRAVAGELTAAARRWHMHVERVPSRTDPGGTILRISEVRRVEPQHDNG